MMTLKFPNDLHKELNRRYKNHHRAWLANTDQFPLMITLGTPNERQSPQQLETTQAWISAWQSCQCTGNIIWRERRWRNHGVQRLPEKIILQTPNEIAAWIGQAIHWEKACQRYQLFISKWPELTACLPRYCDVLAEYTDANIQRLVSVLAWIEANPQSNLYPRQLPIAGIDSKWLEQRKSLISDCVGTLRGSSNQSLDFFQSCGLRPMHNPIRMRLLDKSIRECFNGLEDITIPLHQLAKLNFSVTRVYIIENLQTGLALDDLPESIALMQLGYGVEVLADIPWLQKADCIYWGDIDTHGFNILHRARSHLPKLRSLLMDDKTLQVHQHLWVSEDKQHGAAELPLLTDTEQIVYSGLKQQRWGVNVRLEQERVNWEYAWNQIRKPYL